MRVYASTAAFIVIAVLCLAGGFVCLRISAAIALNTGYGAVVHLQAFGRWPDPEDTRRGWRNQKRFQFVGIGLLALTIPCGFLAVRSFRRAREVRSRERWG